MRDCGFAPKDGSRKGRVPRQFGSVFLLILVGLMLFAVPTAGLATTTSTSGVDVIVENDANHDGIFSDVENVPKNATYPWTVTYRMTITTGSARPTITSITDDKTGAPLNTAGVFSPSCSTLVGSTLPLNSSTTCYYDGSVAAPGAVPFVNTGTIVWNSGGRDTAWDTSAVNFPALTLDKTSTTTLVTALGQVVPYSYLVSNTGSVTVTGIAVTDNNVDAAPSCPQSSLAPGTSMTCTAQHTVTQAELNAGHVDNAAVASSTEAANATDNLSIPVAQSPAGGNFVVGDLTVGPLGQAIGKGVTFWGAQWWKLNSLSGGVGPAAFKGFQDAPAQPACGVDWTAKPGNSTPPPATIPAFMAVIVSSGITKSGASIGGDTLHLVIVKTDAGYEGNPGHAGTGTIVGIIC